MNKEQPPSFERATENETSESVIYFIGRHNFSNLRCKTFLNVLLQSKCSAGFIIYRNIGLLKFTEKLGKYFTILHVK
uniref:Uncharacterized protein n=1 Tax=Octopus bimaculoides TaxID=37653 RepID=A0A0L8HFD3_OCTBM